MTEGVPKTKKAAEEKPKEEAAPQAPPTLADVSSEALAKEEAHLSPETIEKIMEKVQDINSIGTAYSILRHYPLDNEGIPIEKVLQEGLLGNPRHNREGSTTHKERWLQSMKSREKDNVIWFNIVGRSVKETDSEESSLTNCLHLDPTQNVNAAFGRNVVILFDIHKYTDGGHKEVDITKYGLPEVKKPRGRHFYYDSWALAHRKNWKLKEDEVPQSEGFYLHNRVSPRDFTGLVITNRISYEEVFRRFKEELKSKDELYYRNAIRFEHGDEERAFHWDFTRWKDNMDIRQYIDRPPQEWHSMAEDIAAEMVRLHLQKPGLIVPIYSVYGDLLWPKQMSYEEVKKYVAEREDKKAEDEPER